MAANLMLIVTVMQTLPPSPSVGRGPSNWWKRRLYFAWREENNELKSIK
jgi:hypothetical protein